MPACKKSWRWDVACGWGWIVGITSNYRLLLYKYEGCGGKKNSRRMLERRNQLFWSALSNGKLSLWFFSRVPESFSIRVKMAHWARILIEMPIATGLNGRLLRAIIVNIGDRLLAGKWVIDLLMLENRQSKSPLFNTDIINLMNDGIVGDTI